MKKILLLSLFFLATTLVSSAQYGSFGGCKVISKSGDVKILKSEKFLKVEYDYSQIKVGAFNSEDEYVSQKVSELNTKEPGRGDKWKAGWENSRKERYQPKFQELFNKRMQKSGITLSENPKNAKYTLIVKTTFIEPGFNVGVAKKPAFANFEFLIVETGNPAKPVSELYLNNVIGSQAMGFDFDTGSRVAESYAKAGKMLGDFIYKALTK